MKTSVDERRGDARQKKQGARARDQGAADAFGRQPGNIFNLAGHEDHQGYNHRYFYKKQRQSHHVFIDGIQTVIQDDFLFSALLMRRTKLLGKRGDKTFASLGYIVNVPYHQKQIQMFVC